jgi:hypothetical protein
VEGKKDVPRIALPKAILWDMQVAGVLPSAVIAGSSREATQLVECTPEMAAWCRREARIHHATAGNLIASADVIERAIRVGPTTL